MADRGHQVTVYTTYPHYPEWEIWNTWKPAKHRLRVLVNENLAVVRVRHYVPKTPSSFKRLVSEISFGARILFERLGRQDVIICVSPGLFSTLMVLTQNRFILRIRPRCVVWVQDIYTAGVTQLNQSSNTFLTTLLRRAESRVLEQANRIVSIHQRHLDFLSEELGVGVDKVDIIRNWAHIHATSAPTAAAVADFRKMMGWGSEKKVVLHTGNMGLKQDLTNVIDAARFSVRSDGPGTILHFVLMGNGVEVSKLQAAAHDVAAVEVIAPVADELYLVALASADILLVNEAPGSRDVAVPSKMTSYFSAGKPIIAATESESATSSELKYSNAGIAVDPGKPVLLYRAASALANDRTRMDAFGRNASAYFERFLSEDTAIDAFEALLVSSRCH